MCVCMKKVNNITNYTVEDLFSSRARVKILRELALEEELNISKIIENTNLNHSCTVRHLDYLLEIGFLGKREYGRVKIYRYKGENVKANSVKNFIEGFENGLYPNVKELFYSKYIIRIIRNLALCESLNISRIIEITRSNYGTIKRHLDFLTGKGFLIAKNFGRIRIYKYNYENNGSYLIKKLIDLIEGEKGENYNSNLLEIQS